MDQIGYSEDALDSLKKEKKLTDATVIEYKNDTTGFASSWLGNKIGLKATTSDRVISVFEKLGFSDTPKPMYYYGGL